MIGLAEAAPVHGDHVPVALERIDQELEGSGHVHPAMQHEQLGRAGISPLAHVRAEPPQRDKFGTRGFRDGHCFCLRVRVFWHARLKPTRRPE